MHGMHDGRLAGIDMNLLVVLHALLREKNVTRAARRLGLSQSATSHALGRLRRLFDDRLLVQSGRLLRPTPHAERLMPQLERAIEAFEGVLRGEPRFEPKTARRRFRLGMADYTQALVLEPLLSRVAQEAPFVDLEITMEAGAQELVRNGELDIGFTVQSAVLSSLVSERLFVEEFVCVLRKGHPVSKRGLSLDDYLSLGHVLVAPSGSPGSVVDSELSRRGLQRRIALRVASFLIVPFVIASSNYINTAPARLAKRMAKLLPLKLLPPPLPVPGFELHLCYQREIAADPALRWLIELIKDVCREI